MEQGLPWRERSLPVPSCPCPGSPQGVPGPPGWSQGSPGPFSDPPRSTAHVSATPPALPPCWQSEPLPGRAPIPILKPIPVSILPAPLTMVRAAAPGRPPVRSGAAGKRLWGGHGRRSFHSPGARPPPRAGLSPPRAGGGVPGSAPALPRPAAPLPGLGKGSAAQNSSFPC